MKNAGFVTKSDFPKILNQYGVATKSDVQNTVRSEMLASERRLKLRIGKIRNDLAQRIATVAIDTHTKYSQLKQKVETSYA